MSFDTYPGKQEIKFANRRRTAAGLAAAVLAMPAVIWLATKADRDLECRTTGEMVTVGDALQYQPNSTMHDIANNTGNPVRPDEDNTRLHDPMRVLKEYEEVTGIDPAAQLNPGDQLPAITCDQPQS